MFDSNRRRARRLTLRLFAAALCVAGALPAAAADPPSGESILERFIEKSGGEAAYAKVKTSEMTGDVEIAGRNIKGRVTIAEDGEKSWTAMDLPGIGRIEQAYDGVNAWEVSAVQGPRLIEGDEKSALRRGSSLSLPRSWREEYKQVRTVGSEDIGGRPAWKVEMTPKEGKPETYFFDKDSGLLVRMASIVSTALGDISTSVAISDYRPVDGIETPFSISQDAMGQTIVMHFPDKVSLQRSAAEKYLRCANRREGADRAAQTPVARK